MFEVFKNGKLIARVMSEDCAWSIAFGRKRSNGDDITIIHQKRYLIGGIATVKVGDLSDV